MNAKRLYRLFEKSIKISRKEFFAYCASIPRGGEFPPLTQKWVESCYHRPAGHEIVLHAFDEICGTHGVEYIGKEETKQGVIVEYLNVGDPYVPTLLYCPAWVNPYKIAEGGYASVVK
jgi:hypothetical protein